MAAVTPLPDRDCKHGLNLAHCTLCTGRDKQKRFPVTALRAEMLHRWLIAIEDMPATKSDIAAALGLTEEQVDAALRYLRDHYPDTPLIGGPDGIEYTKDENKVNAYAQWRKKTAFTQLRRLVSGVLHPFSELPEHQDNPELRRVVRQIKRILEDIEDVKRTDHIA